MSIYELNEINIDRTEKLLHNKTCHEKSGTRVTEVNQGRSNFMKKRRFLALLLAIIMAVSVTPLAGHAVETDEYYLPGGDGTGDECAERYA